MAHPPHPTCCPPSGWADVAGMLELEGAVLRSHLLQATGWVRRLAGGVHRRRVLDLGSGPGGATTALAQLFAGAEVIALDGSVELLDRVAARALDLGLADRVTTVQADLDGGWPRLDTVDVVWASMSLHHLADPDRTLGDVHAAMRPGGLLTVAETAVPVRFLPDDLGTGRPGLETRLHAALGPARAEALPHLGSDWSARLRGAGFVIVAERTFPLGPGAAATASTARWARWSLSRLRSAVGDRIAAADRAALDALLGDGPGSLLRRRDLVVRGTRPVLAALRP